jgi:hypothetical protein
MFPSPLPIILTAIGLLFREDDRVAPDADPPPAPPLTLISAGNGR